MGLPTLNAKYYNEATICEQKWAADGYLDGLPRVSKRDRDIRLSTSLMMENQALANEQMAASGTGADDIAQFRRITVPMVRRFFPPLIAHHIVGVQPLVGPSGYVFYMRFRAGIEKGNQDGLVGIDSTSVMMASVRIVRFRLLLMSEPNVSIVSLKTSV